MNLRTNPELLPLIEWWEKDGKETVIYLLVAAIAVGGWYGWKHHKAAVKEAASNALVNAYTTEEIAAFPLILLEKKASSRTYLEKYFLQSGVRLTPEIELGARSLLVDLAKIGFGVTGVTREFVQGELAAGEIRELSTAFSIPPRTVDLCMLRNVSPSAATERFARDVLEKLQGKSVSV